MTKHTLLALLLLTACGKDSSQCANSTTVFNGQTINLVNGVCSAQSQVNWQNTAYKETLLCGMIIVTQNNQVCQILASSITPSTIGCTLMSDGYQVFPSSDNKSQCWFSIKNGAIDNSIPPSF